MIKKFIFFIFFCSMVISSNAQSINSLTNYLKNSNQFLLVKTPFANSIKGTMFLYERRNNRKHLKLVDSFAVVVGKNGLGKDSKHEGDGKCPAGIFPLGSVFSYHKIEKIKMPFVQVDTNFYCVDDMASSYYNTLIVADTAKHDYNSFEYMKRKDSLYEFGVWVLYNSNPVIPGNGSCIFLHIWRNENTGTAGCTAMSKEHMLEVIHWLDKKKNPVLLQGIESKIQ